MRPDHMTRGRRRVLSRRFHRVFAVVVLAGGMHLLHAGVARAGTLIITGPDNAEVTLGARPLGMLPLAHPIDLEPGAYVVRCHPPGYRNFEMQLDVTGPTSEHIIRVSLEPYRRRDVVGRGLVFAGLAQHYLDRPRLAWALSAVEATGIALGIAGDTSMRSRRDEYNQRYDVYRAATAEADIVAARDAANASWRRLEDAEDLRRKGVAIAMSAIAVGLLDGWLRFPHAGLEAPRDARSASGVGYGGGTPLLVGATGAGLRVTWRTRF